MLFPVLLLLIVLQSPALCEEWKFITDTRNVKDMISFDNRLWMATDGGLVEYSPSGNTYQVYTPLDGLGGIGVSRLMQGSDDAIWIAFANRMLQRFDPEQGVTHTISTISQQEGVQSLNDLAIDSRGLFVATSRGVALITYTARYDQWVWFEEYRRLGTFDPDIPVRSVLIEGDTIWAATPAGIARGNLNSPPPLDWINYTAANGLPSPDVTNLLRVSGILYATTEQGTVRFNGVRWERINGRRDVYRLLDVNDTLYAVTSDGLSRWEGGQWLRVGQFKVGGSAAVRDSNQDFWLGVKLGGYSSGGIAALEDTVWQAISLTGPSSNLILAAHFARDGSSYFTGGRTTGEFGLAKYRSDIWETWTMPENSGTPFQFQGRSIAEDRLGGIWVGTYGGGVAHYDSTGVLTVYNADPATGGRLIGYEGKPNQPLTAALAADDAGNVWILDRGARDGNILVCVPYQWIADPDTATRWHYFHRSNFRSFSEFDLLTIDGYGRKWIASTANNPSISGDQGVYVFDDRGTIADTTDDRVWGPLTGLPSAEVISLEWDPAGYVWAGSPRGAYYAVATGVEFSFTQVYAMREIPIYSIDIDPAENKWFGTEFGVSILSPDLFSITRRITTDPPDKLPDARVRLVAVDPYSGWAYLGTGLGTAVVRTPYRDYGQELTSLTFEPNPFNPDRSRLIFTGNSLAGGAAARIFSPDGRLIRKLAHDEASIGWDGRDNSGREVADGVYLILTHNGAGQAAQGKVAVIRR